MPGSWERHPHETDARIEGFVLLNQYEVLIPYARTLPNLGVRIGWQRYKAFRKEPKNQVTH